MAKYEKLRQYIIEIDDLRKLHWKNPRSGVWINKVLRYLKQEAGEDYHKQFYNATHGPVVVVSGTPDSQFQHEYLERLDRYAEYLKAFLAELEDVTEEQKLIVNNQADIQQTISTLDTLIGIFSNVGATRKMLNDAVKLYMSSWVVAKNSFTDRADLDILKLNNVSIPRLFLDAKSELTAHRKELVAKTQSLKKIFVDNLPNNTTQNNFDSLYLVEKICLNFHRVVRQLKDRYEDRETFKITDEYDVQDLLKSLLKIHFDDIRSEEWTPSYAGSSKRMDILLKSQKIVLEVKKTRKNLTDKNIGEQLTVDKAYYKNHPDCKILYCFVYDPDELISNPIGLENDLSENYEQFHVIVKIVQK